MLDVDPAFSDAVGDELPDELRARVKAELDPGERLLWAGRPSSARLGGSTPTSAKVAVGALAVATTDVLVVATTPLSRNDVVFTVGLFLGLVALIVGLFAALGTIAEFTRRAKKKKKRAATVYALTDRRALFWTPVGEGSVAVHSVPRGGVSIVYRVEHPDGTGDVMFDGNPDLFDYHYGRRFADLSDVRRIEEQVRRILVVEKPPSPTDRHEDANDDAAH
jgi:hypothetical protein